MRLTLTLFLLFSFFLVQSSDAHPKISFWNAKLAKRRPLKWERKTENTVPWSKVERERTLEALSQMPEALLPKKLRGIYRMDRSKDFPNPASSDDKEIVLYNSAFDPDRNLAQIISHELAHLYYRNLKQQDFDSYRKATNWFNVSNSGLRAVYKTTRSNFVQDDGKTSVEEDFANNVEYYLFHPDELKRTTPQATIWIHSHFGDNFKVGTGGARAH